MRKEIKIRIITNLILLIISIIAFYIAVSKESAYLFGFSSTLFILSLIGMINNILILKNPEKLSKIKIIEKDERNVTLMNNSYALTFRITLFIEGIAIIFFVFQNKQNSATLIAFIIYAQLITYMIVRYRLSKKI